MSSSAPSFYGPVDDPQSDALLEAYVGFLRERNGEPDFGSGLLPERERSLASMDSSEVRFAGELDQGQFDRLYASFSSSDPELTPALLAVLAFVKLNAGEAYGVRVTKKAREAVRKRLPPNVLRTELFVQEEETYHTRILVGAARHFDLHAEGAYKPTLPLKVLIHSLSRAPQFLFHPILLASELMGVYCFNWVLEQLPRFFKDQPQLLEELERRLVEVLIDELGHVAFNRLVMGPRGRAVGYRLGGLVVRGLTKMTPELSAMGFDRNAERAMGGFDLANLPEEVRRRGFFA